MDNLSTFSNKGGSDEIAERVIREFGVLSGQRGIWEAHWEEIAERIWTNMSWKFNPNWFSTPGQKKTEKVFDSTAALALNRFGAILDSLLTPANSKWHTLSAVDAKVNQRSDVKKYFEDVTKILFHYRYMGGANFPSQNQQNYKSLGGFGTGCLFTDAMTTMGKKPQGMRYKAISLGEVYFVENHQGVVDKAFRYFALTIRQAIQKWGDKLPKNISDLANTDPEMVRHFIHLVEPREDWDENRLDAKGKKWASYYVSKEEASTLEEGGFNVFPYSVSRYEQYPGEVYGRSPAMDVLPSVKTLNEEKKTILKQGQRIVDPVLLFHDDGVIDGFSLKPGAMNAGGVDANGRVLVHTLPTGNLSVGKEMMEEEKSTINDAFLVSLFQILTESPQMTATEVLERMREKGILLAPTIGRQQSEYLSPLIERELDILAQQGILPPMPQYLKDAGGDFKIVYDSPLSRAQRAEEASGLARTVESLLPVVQNLQDPSVLDHFDWDKIAVALAEINAVPHSWMKSDAEVQQAKQMRAAQMQKQQQVQAAPGAAAMINAGAKVHQALNGGGQ